MGSELDERGLEAAIATLRTRLPLDRQGRYPAKAYAEMAIAAYLAAVHQEPEDEMDRIAVVVDADGRALGVDMLGMPPDNPNWRGVEMDAEEIFVMRGPFVRAIVAVKLPRPAEPVVVRGSVT